MRWIKAQANNVTVTAFIAVILNLALTEEIEDEAASITANEADAADDQEEWARIKRGKDEEIREKTGPESVSAK
jgi:hypothetical protein